MYRPNVVYGLLRDEQQVDETLEDLESHGIRRGEIELTSPSPGRYALADEHLHDDAVATGSGALRGMGVGALVAAAVGALIVGGSATGGFGLFLAITAAGVGFGGMVGAMFGLQRDDHEDDDDASYEEVGGTSRGTLVTVHSLHWRNRAHAILLKHGARILESPTPMATSRPGV